MVLTKAETDNVAKKERVEAAALRRDIGFADGTSILASFYYGSLTSQAIVKQSVVYLVVV